MVLVSPDALLMRLMEREGIKIFPLLVWKQLFCLVLISLWVWYHYFGKFGALWKIVAAKPFYLIVGGTVVAFINVCFAYSLLMVTSILPDTILTSLRSV